MLEAPAAPSCVHCQGKSQHPVIWHESRHERAEPQDIYATHVQARSVDVCLPCLIRLTHEAVQDVEHGQDRRSEAIIEERVSDAVDRIRILDRLHTFTREASEMRHRMHHPRDVAGCALCRRAAA